MLVARDGKYPHALQSIKVRLWTNLNVGASDFDLIHEHPPAASFRFLSAYNESSHNLSPMLHKGTVHWFGGRALVKKNELGHVQSDGGVEHFKYSIDKILGRAVEYGRTRWPGDYYTALKPGAEGYGDGRGLFSIAVLE